MAGMMLEERSVRVGPDAGFMHLLLVGNAQRFPSISSIELEQPETERKTLPDGRYESVFRDFPGEGYYHKLRLVDVTLFGAALYECPFGQPVCCGPTDSFTITWEFSAFTPVT